MNKTWHCSTVGRACVPCAEVSLLQQPRIRVQPDALCCMSVLSNVLDTHGNLSWPWSPVRTHGILPQGLFRKKVPETSLETHWDPMEGPSNYWKFLHKHSCIMVPSKYPLTWMVPGTSSKNPGLHQGHMEQEASLKTNKSKHPKIHSFRKQRPVTALHADTVWQPDHHWCHSSFRQD